MAMLIIDDNSRELPDNTTIQSICEEFGVQFGCQNGFCRTCEVTIIEGYDNLFAMTENEEFIGLKYPRRLACQCKIKTGTVKLKVE